MTAGAKLKLAVAWSGLPWYAARLIRRGLERVGADAEVLGTRPKVPMSGMEQILGRPICWLEKHRLYRWQDLNLPVPDLFIHTGWNIPCFNSLAEEVRAHDGKVVGMIDNNYQGTLRQYVGALVFRLSLRRRFWQVWVPGRAGRKLLRFLGMPGDLIREGLYGADPALLHLGPPLEEREMEMLFVGQLIPRKGIATLLEAFAAGGFAARGWTLRIIGEGPERSSAEGRPGVQLQGFLPEAEVAAAMRHARVLILPSHEEHWGMVLAEAALAGCALVSSHAVGAAADLIDERNGLVFVAGEARQLGAALEAFAAWPPDRLREARAASRSLGEEFGPEKWAGELKVIVNEMPRRWASGQLFR